jgi:hypothetical protein
MFGIVRHYKTEPGQIDAIVRHTRERFMQPISHAWGFVSWTLIDAGPDGVVTASVFEDELGAELAAGWVRENQAATELGHPKISEGPVAFRDVKEHVHSGYGFVWHLASKPGEFEDAKKRVVEGFIPTIAELPGYAAHGAIDAGHGALSWLLVFADEDSAKTARERARAWADKNLGSLLAHPPEIVFGEVKLRIPAHATVSA